MNADFRLDEDLPCTDCGRFGAFPFDGGALCGDCYAQRGTCSPAGTSAEKTIPAMEVESPPAQPTSR